MMLSKLLFFVLPTLSLSFVLQSESRVETALFDGDGTGGWGIGSSRELKPEEFARSDRAHFDGYKMSEQGDFRRQLADDQKALRKQELEELMGVAAIAGISVKNPKDRLNKFEDAAFPDDDEELDLSI
ncbi:MAG: hypothetical protein SGBAC_003482 [Bacillariaceae sp.]